MKRFGRIKGSIAKWAARIGVAYGVATIVWPVRVFAAVGAGTLPWDDPLTALQTDLQGPVAHAITTAAVIGTGLMWAVSEHGTGVRKMSSLAFGGACALGATQADDHALPDGRSAFLGAGGHDDCANGTPGEHDPSIAHPAHPAGGCGAAAGDRQLDHRRRPDPRRRTALVHRGDGRVALNRRPLGAGAGREIRPATEPGLCPPHPLPGPLPGARRHLGARRRESAPSVPTPKEMRA